MQKQNDFSIYLKNGCGTRSWYWTIWNTSMDNGSMYTRIHQNTSKFQYDYLTRESPTNLRERAVVNGGGRCRRQCCYFITLVFDIANTYINIFLHSQLLCCVFVYFSGFASMVNDFIFVISLWVYASCFFCSCGLFLTVYFILFFFVCHHEARRHKHTHTHVYT